MKKIALLLCFVSALILSGCSNDDDKGGDSNITCDTVCTQQGDASIHSGLVGTYSLTYDEIVAGGPFSAGDKVDFTLTSGGTLQVTFGNQCVAIENGVDENYEVSFTDNCVFDIVFKVSDNVNGNFNEVNILTLQGQFLGQFPI